MERNKWTTVSALVGAAAVGAGSVYYWLLQRPLPQTDGILRVPGVSEQVAIYRDPWGVPHIYAQTMPDLLFAQGFVHAQDRLWQMEFWRRLVAGRLSEVVGERTVPVDRWVRTLGMRQVAEQEAAQADGALREQLEAYVAGINAAIAQGKLPVEFSLLRYDPEPWQLADLFAWGKMMAWHLSVNWQTEIIRAQLIDLLGPELAAELEVAYDGPLVVPPGVDYAGIGATALSKAADAAEWVGPPPEAGLGSNNWVVGGRRTTTGAPLLASDMHLSMSMPCIWYENHLVCQPEGFNVMGVSFSGIPYVMVGHNNHIAWAFTNGFPDVQDLYIERLRHEEGRVLYEYQGEWLPAEVRREVIEVKGAEPVIEEVIVTHHGPIINSLVSYPAGEPLGEAPLALRWTAHETDEQFRAVYLMNRARNCREFHEATRDWSVPVQNMVSADRAGNIAYSFPGRLPIRAKGDGRVPVPGWTGEYEWTGYVPFAEVPHYVNPSQGYIVTANNRVVDDAYPYPLGYDFSVKDRAERIHEMIRARERVDVAAMQEMQYDVLSLTARALRPFWAELTTDDAELTQVIGLMRGWDGRLKADSAAAAVYQVFMRRLLRLVLAERLGELMAYYAGQGPTPLLAETNQFGARSWEWLLRILHQPDSHWFAPEQGRARDDLMRQALRQAVDFLTKELGADKSEWAWGRLHQLTFPHPLGNVRPLDKLFNRGPFPIGGDSTTVCATGAHFYDLATASLIGPPYRMIADLSDWRNCVSMLAPGQSGQPGSKHYDDQVEAFFNRGYHPMLFYRQEVEEQAQTVLWLQP